MNPDLERLLTQGGGTAPRFSPAAIRCQTTNVTMRDGIRLATDLYLPPDPPRPTIVMRTPYGRAADPLVGTFLWFARRGYIVVAQDCRGTGESEPDHWDYYIYEAEDGYDLVEWIVRQDWYDGFIGACGGSYVGQTQWCMAVHPRMSTIAPEVSGVGVAVNTAHIYLSLAPYARSVGKGAGRKAMSYAALEAALWNETLAGGYFNEALQQPFSPRLKLRYPELRACSLQPARRWLWGQYCALPAARRVDFIKDAVGSDCLSILDVEALSGVFGQEISHDAHALPYADAKELCRNLNAPALIHTGWYDWGLNDALATWQYVTHYAQESIAKRSRLIIAPSAHNSPGYLEGLATHPELRHNHRTPNHPGLLLRWYEAVRRNATDSWPAVIYYLMGANEWREASTWPPPETSQLALYLGPSGALTIEPPPQNADPDRYVYDPADPTPTVGGSIVSAVLQPGSVDVSSVQKRPDVLTYTTEPLDRDIDVAGPLRMILYASSSARDTDFVVRLSDVFPDDRALQIQNGILRARHRDRASGPQLLAPGRVYRLEIDLWATANRFKAGHRLRIDISSADFPRFDRNTNRGGEPGDPIRAHQSIHHDAEHPSHVILPVLRSGLHSRASGSG